MLDSIVGILSATSSLEVERVPAGQILSDSASNDASLCKINSCWFKYILYEIMPFYEVESYKTSRKTFNNVRQQIDGSTFHLAGVETSGRFPMKSWANICLLLLCASHYRAYSDY